MEKLDIKIKPRLQFSLKKCGDVVPYGITPEEREKLSGIEENANNYTHPDTHPASILDVVDAADGSDGKFLNERGDMVEISHEKLTDKNSEAAFQHVDSEEKQKIADAATVAYVNEVLGEIETILASI